jgi:hypothetical protein
MADIDCINPEEHCALHACQTKPTKRSAEVDKMYEDPRFIWGTAEQRSITGKISASRGSSNGVAISIPGKFSSEYEESAVSTQLRRPPCYN